jgi:hypothetical protein
MLTFLPFNMSALAAEMTVEPRQCRCQVFGDDVA